MLNLIDDRKHLVENILLGSSNRLRSKYFEKYHNNIFREIINHCDNIDVNMHFKGKLWYWVNNIKHKVLCECGNITSLCKKWESGYKKYCSNKCSNSSILVINKKRNANVKKFGVDSYSKTDEYKKRVKVTNLERYGVESFSKTDKYKEKTIKTNLIKYGTEYYTQTNSCKERTIKTNLEKYGVESVMNINEVKHKIKITNLERYGVDSYSKTEECKRKVILTNLEKYNKIHYAQTEESKCKVIKSNLEKYGFDSYSKTEEYKNRVILTNLNKYGVKYYTQTEEYKNKVILTNLNKYGADHYIKSEIYHMNTNIGNNKDYIKYLGNGISLFNCSDDHTFEIKTDNYFGRNKYNLPLCTVCYPIGDSQSIKEKELLEYIKSIYFGEIISSYRDGLEIDIYLPELKIGFEFNGLYWHSSKFKDKNYHLDKTNYFKEKNIRIIHIYEDDYNDNLKIIKSQINNLLKVNSERIFSRKCYVKEIKDSKIVTKFLNENHIQGKVNSTLKLGLYSGDKLVSLMTFDRFEGRLKMEEGGWNLNRFCNVINTSVVGSASKLLSYFIKNYDVRRIVSYADKDWSVGNLYEVLGFNKISESNPDYKYIVDSKRVHKSRYKKDNLNLEDKTKTTEKEEMLKRNIFKIYDCGKIKYQKINFLHI